MSKMISDTPAGYLLAWQDDTPPVYLGAQVTSPDKTYRVQGMSCGHCEAAVRRALERVSGIEAVEVDLPLSGS